MEEEIETSILAKYTFTISCDKDSKRYIQVEMPPLVTMLDLDNIYSWCQDAFEVVKEDALKNNKSKDE